MNDEQVGGPRAVDLVEAAEVLRLPLAGVQALVGAGYLRPTGTGPEGPHFALVDLKAFLARNSDGTGPGSGEGALESLLDDLDDVDPSVLLSALDGKSEDMALRAFDIFASVFPEARQWPLDQQRRFIDQARSRFEAILAVTAGGEAVDEALTVDLHDVGAAAAQSGSPLPQLLVILRISRDLVVQTAVELAEERGRHWGLALSLLLTRVLPAIDRLTDSIAEGYWAAIVAIEEEARARYENVVESSTDGVYEIDLDGRITYANQSLAVILARRLGDLHGERLGDVIVPLDETQSVEHLTSQRAIAGGATTISVRRRDDSERVLSITTLARQVGDDIVGFQGVVRDLSAQVELDRRKNEFLELITEDLRQPLTTVLGLGVTLDTYAHDLGPDRVRSMGRSIHRQSERMARLADDLYDVARLESQSLTLSPRVVPLTPVVHDALATVPLRIDVHVDVPSGAEVWADPRRLEQVLANLVENAQEHGRPPVTVDARAHAEGVLITVTDHGDGVPDRLVATLFSRLRTMSRRDRDAARGTGLGLALVRGLVEAMSGRVWYETAPGGGAAFKVVLPSPDS